VGFHLINKQFFGVSYCKYVFGQQIDNTRTNVRGLEL